MLLQSGTCAAAAATGESGDARKRAKTKSHRRVAQRGPDGVAFCPKQSDPEGTSPCVALGHNLRQARVYEATLVLGRVTHIPLRDSVSLQLPLYRPCHANRRSSVGSSRRARVAPPRGRVTSGQPSEDSSVCLACFESKSVVCKSWKECVNARKANG